MEEKLTKTSWKQRLIIIIVAVVMLGSFIAVYMGIVLGSNKSTSTDTSSKVDEAKINELTEQYTAKKAEVDKAAKSLNDKWLPTLKKYKSEVKSYNSATANNEGLKTKDLEVGKGKELKSGDTDYFAYYIGWCADESIFDSSFDDSSNPTALNSPLDPSVGLIQGWTEGVVGMKLGGVREITIPGELAYGESQEICGGKNSPLKFVIAAIEKTEPLKTLNAELTEITMKLQYAYYGIDPDQATSSAGGAEAETK